ncbi:hypothetical protein RL73_02665 [Liberibacter crescens]|nr:hypothetical protein RL73_02665 [Liberibacter crescens]
MSSPALFPAPVKGLVTVEDFQDGTAGSARVLRNFWPTVNGASIRGGSIRKALLADGGAVVSTFVYKKGDIRKIFAATNTAIYDMSTAAVLPNPTTASVSGLSSGEWCVFQHNIVGNFFLVAVNGRDERQVYDGTQWRANIPAITFDTKYTMSSSRLLYGWLFKRRQWYVGAGTMDAWYLDADAAGGAAHVFPLGGIFQLGGSLLAGFSWSIESGDGLSALCVFLSTEGEIAVYAGNNPDVATDFSLKGIYQIARPLGRNALADVGSDIWIATSDGLIAMSQVLLQGRKDTSQLSFLSRPIEREWRRAVSINSTNWSMITWPARNCLLISFSGHILPYTNFVLNVLTNSWSIFTNWYSTSFAESDGNLYFGDDSGTFWHADVSGTDDGRSFSAAYISSFSYGDNPEGVKRACSAHMLFKSVERPNVKLFARSDGNETVPLYTTANQIKQSSGTWDNATWDVSRFDSIGALPVEYGIRQNVFATGRRLAVGCVLVSSGDFALNIEIGAASLVVEGGSA